MLIKTISIGIGVIASAIAAIVQQAEGLGHTSILTFSVLTGVASGGISWGLLKGRVDAHTEQIRLDREASEKHYEGIQDSMAVVTKTVMEVRSLVDNLSGEVRGERLGRAAGIVHTRENDK